MGGGLLRIPCAAVLLAAVAGCNRAETPAPVPTKDPPPTRYEQLCAARGLAPAPPATLARHYRMLGAISFATDSGDLVQEAELWAGGPTRMKVMLRQEHAKVVFLLADASRAWTRRGHEDEFGEYPAVELAREAWLRWQMLRFPWDWRAAVEAAAPDAEAITRDSPFGPATITLDANALPRRAHLGELTVSVSEWTDLPRGGRVPARWAWESPAGRREDRWTRIEDGHAFLDTAFRPGEATIPVADVVRVSPDAAPSETQEELRVVEMPLRWLPPGAGALQGDAPLPGSWWTVAGERRYLLATSAADPGGDEVVHVPTRRYLHWTSHLDLAREDALAQLRAAAEGAGLVSDPPAWTRGTDDGRPGRRRDYLMPLQ